ncbi:MAG: hypothetical protein Q4D23_00215 [Bacteroidales bacterium]|nr:hypothetical protein [Bacteroidales bacterium]
MQTTDKIEINNKIDIPLGVIFFVCDPRFPEFSKFVIERRKELEVKVWEYLSGLIPECQALGGVKIHIVDTFCDWQNFRCLHRQIARFEHYTSFNAPPTPEFIYRLPSLNNLFIAHHELAEILPLPDETDNDAVGVTFTAKGWAEEEWDVGHTAIIIADDFKRQLYDYNTKILQRYAIRVATHYKIPAKHCKDLLWRAMWESEVDLLALNDDKSLADYESEVKWFGISEGLPHGFVSMLVIELDIDESEFNIKYDHDHYYSEDHRQFLNKNHEVEDTLLNSLAETKLFELRHTDGCPKFYRVSFHDTDSTQNKNSMYLADFYIEQYNLSPIRKFVDEWIDSHSNTRELALVKKNGKGVWNSCHEYYLEEAACLIVQSAATLPRDMRFYKDGIDFVKNDRPGTYAYYPLQAFPFLCMLYTLFTFSDNYMYDNEKLEKLFQYLQCYYNKEFHAFVSTFNGILRNNQYEQEENDFTQNRVKGRTEIDKAHAVDQELTIPKKPGRKAVTLEECITSDDKDNEIEMMRAGIGECPDGPSEAAYINNMLQEGRLKRIPSYNQMKEHGLTKVGATAWNNAIKPYRTSTTTFTKFT